MSEENENKLDKFIRDGFTDAENHAAFRDNDWDAMEQMLDNSTRKRGIINMYTIAACGIAAMLLIALGWFYLNPTEDYQKPAKTIIVVKTDTHPSMGGHPVHNQKGRELNASTIVTHTKSSILSYTNPRGKSLFTLSDSIKRGHNIGKVKAGTLPSQAHGVYINQQLVPDTSNKITSSGNANTQSVVKEIQTVTIAPTKTDSVINSSTVVANNTTVTQPAVTTQALNYLDTGTTKSNKLSLPKKRINSNTAQAGFAVSVLTAPDLNNSGPLSQTKVGVNFGVIITYQFTSKLSVSTGAGYAIKPYNGGSGSYRDFANWGSQPSGVYANCKVLDIPLNVNYQVYNKHKASFSFGTGLSSYFMLKENYRFEYVGATTGYSPVNVTINNKNKNLFGVLNLNATYTKQINSKFGVMVQPYYKIPLGKIGFTQADLQSVGIAVGVQLNLHSLKRQIKK